MNTVTRPPSPHTDKGVYVSCAQPLTQNEIEALARDIGGLTPTRAPGSLH